MRQRFHLAALPARLVCLLMIGGGALAIADDNENKAADDVTAENAKAKVLEWIEDYRKEQVLFHDDDIARLQKELAEDTPEEAIKWWQRTASMREALESPQWQETREWLREFLKVQAIFSDEEVDELRTEAKEAARQGSPRDFRRSWRK